MTVHTHDCDYCGLPFTGAGYSPDGKSRFCCCGCYLVQQIVGAQGEESVAAWIIIRLGIGAFLAMNVMMISLVLYLQSPNELGAGAVTGLRWAMLVLATPAVLILGGPFALGGIRELRRMRLSTDALIVTGSMAAYGVSAAHVLRGAGHAYFDTATMLLLIVTLGRLFEASAKNSTSKAIRDLAHLMPGTAHVIRNGGEVEIPCSEVREGDLVVARPGERIAADGRIVSGRCGVEESAFTGEARPRLCEPGDLVYGGSTNCDGVITVEATGVGPQSVLAQIQELVRRAQLEQPPVERLVERVAAVFVPAVWLAAAGAAAYWGLARHDLERAGLASLAVLVVACPCALGLATPLAACLALGRAARSGVLIRSGAVLERLAAVQTVFFDKTGTLTTGELTIAGVRTWPDGELSQDEVLAWAAPLASGSEHAIARAIAAARETQGELSEFRAYPGLGAAGDVTLNGTTRRVTLGSLRLLREEHSVPEHLSEVSEALTASYVGWGGQVRAAVLLADSVRLDAAGAVRALTSSGVDVAVVSGDREAVVRQVAGQLGITHVLAECLPAAKAEAVRKASHGGAVAMVGDGINDAPALAAADVGITLCGATDLARESADVTVLGDSLARIPWVIELARTTYRTMKRNLAWAFGYNCIAVGLAFFGLMHPLIAAIAMLVSSLFVIGNSMRLTRFADSDT